MDMHVVEGRRTRDMAYVILRYNPNDWKKGYNIERLVSYIL